MKKIIVTGAAGFIGFHLSRHLLELGHSVCGLDRLNTYYDPALKQARLDILSKHRHFSFHRAELTDLAKTGDIVRDSQAEIMYHLAAQAGVRYSLENPQSYAQSNLIAFLNILEICRHHPVRHLIYASSSSVYGLNRSTSFKETTATDSPVSLYAATKKSNEAMAHAYAHLYGLPVTGLRFFTLYGPWGRPDMAYYRFAKFLSEGKPLPLYNQGKMERDFTYIDDAVSAMVKLMDKPPPARPNAQPSENKQDAPARILNIGNGNPTSLRTFVKILAEQMQCPVKEESLPMQPGDVLRTYADISALRSLIDWQPEVSLQEGLGRFVEWFKQEGQKYHLRSPQADTASD